MYMISVAEKEFAIKHAMDYFEGPEGMLLYKILAHFAAKTVGFDRQSIEDSVFDNKETMRINAEKLMGCIANIADDDPTPITEIVKIETLDDYMLYVRFRTGEVRLFDFNPLLSCEAFIPLQDKEIFDSVELDHGVPVWRANGLDLDYSPGAILVNGMECDFDTIISIESGGVYALPIAERYRIRDIIDYCSKKGIKISEITDDELEMFKS